MSYFKTSQNSFLALILLLGPVLQTTACPRVSDVSVNHGGPGTVITFWGTGLEIDETKSEKLTIRYLTYDESKGFYVYAYEQVLTTTPSNSTNNKLRITIPNSSVLKGAGEIRLHFEAPELNCGAQFSMAFNFLGVQPPLKWVQKKLQTTANAVSGGVEELLVYDFNSDRAMDIVTYSANTSEIIYFENTDQQSKPTNNPWTRKTIGGGNFSGVKDIARYNNQIFFIDSDNNMRWLYNGVNASAPHSYTTAFPNFQFGMDVADLNNSGNAQIIAGRWPSTQTISLGWYYNASTSNPSNGVLQQNLVNPPNERPLVENKTKDGLFSARDFDDNGFADIISVNDFYNGSSWSSQLVWYKNNPTLQQGTSASYDISFSSKNIIRTSAYAEPVTMVVSADIDGDGDLDLITGSIYEQVCAWYENNNGNFGNRKVFDVSNGANVAQGWAFDVGDIDSDGDMDIVSIRNDNQIAWFENDGNNNFGSPIVLTTSLGNARDVKIMDINNDGDMDIVYTDKKYDEVGYFENVHDGNDVLSFSLSEVSGASDNPKINTENKTIQIEVLNGTDLTNLTPTLELSVGASIAVVPNDYSDKVSLPVLAENLIEQPWEVSVTAVPDAISATFEANQSAISISWDTVKYASDYHLTVLQNGSPYQGFTDYKVLLNNSSQKGQKTITLDILTGLIANTAYTISLEAVSDFGSESSTFSEIILTAPNIPEALELIDNSVSTSGFGLTWNKGGVDKFRVKIYADSTIILDSTLNSNTLEVSNLLPGSTYSAGVSSLNDQDRASAEAIISGILTAPGIPVFSEVNIADVYIDSVLLTWNKPTGIAERYELTLSQLGANDQIINNLSDTAYYYTSFIKGKNYTAKIRAQNISNTGTLNDPFSEFSNEISFLTRPLAPTLSVFGASDITGTSFIASWNPVESASSYGIEVSTDDFETTVAVVSGITATNAQVTELSGGTNYDYRVVAYNASGSSKYSSIGKVLTAPQKPILGDISEISSNTAKLSWDIVAGANGYLVEVSNTDFITFVTGFGPKNTVTNEVSIAGLQSGTDYKARIRAYNASASSDYSDTLSFITIPAQPFNLSTSNITLTSARCSWNNPGGASAYDFQLSTSQSFIDTLFESKATSTNIDLTDLTQRTIYYFRVRANNESGSSAFIASNFETDGEENIAPTGLNLSNRTIDENLAIGTFVGKLTTSDANSIESFTYTFEGSGNDNGSFTIIGDSLFTNTALNFEGKSSYQLAIRTTDSGGLFYSGSLEITIRDINDTPMNLQLSNHTIVAFSAANTAIGSLSVSDEDAGDSHTFSLDSGTDAFVIDGANLQNKVVFTNEEDSTIQIVLRATDSKDAFTTASHEIVVARYIDTDAPVLSNLSATDEFVFGSAPITLTVDVSDFRVSKVEFFTKSITATDFEATDVISQSGTYSLTVNEADLDGVGLVFFVRAEDQAGNVAETEERTISLTFSESSSPKISSITRFGGKLEDYEIIAIPFNFPGTGNRVQEIFNEYNGGIPDKTIWRLIKYNASTETEESNLEDLVASSPIQIGAGYFFNAREAAEVKVGAAEVNTKDPQEVVLQPGWNLIGNPYIIDINWNSVLARNGIEEVGPLRVIDPADPAKWPESALLAQYKGAFVNLMSTTAQTITFSYADKIKADGRISAPELPDYEWFVPISLHQENHSGLASVGMHVRATTGVDALDALTLPKWIRYLEISFDHPEFRYGDLSKDIVPPSEKYSWEFNATSDQNGPTTLQWGRIASNIQSLKLLDISNQVIIDMSVQTAYTFSLNGTKRFKILYSTDPSEQFLSEQVNIGEAYPNPFDVQLSIPISLPGNSSTYDVTLITTDLSGREVWTWTNKEMPAGNHELTMKRTEAMSSGVYLYQLSIKSEDIDLEFTNKIIIK
ncbi:MAG: fibronectin type III domain-containing protein [Marinoscillum sp.]